MLDASKFLVYFRNVNDHDLNKSVSIENRCSKNVENKVEIDAERKKGRRWTEQEHRLFLTGLKELRKVDWIGISRRFVKTRSPSQVASHAQKYFLRQAAIDKKKTSVFGLSLNEAIQLPSGTLCDSKPLMNHSVFQPVPSRKMVFVKRNS